MDRNDTQRRHKRIVALSAAGKTDKEIAKTMGMTRQGVSLVISRKLPKDEELQATYERARAKWQPEVEGLLDHALAEMKDRLTNGQDRVAGVTRDGVAVMVKEKVPFKDLAKGFESLRPSAVGEGGGLAGTVETKMTLDPRDPAVMRALAVGLGLVAPEPEQAKSLPEGGHGD